MGLEKELASLKTRRRIVRPYVMHALLSEAGFERRFGKGDHWIYTHERLRFPLTIDLATRCCRPTCPKRFVRSRRYLQMTQRTLEEYLQLPYGIVVTHDRDDDGAEGYVAEVRELPGCISQGDSPEDAVRNVYDAMGGWISV